MVLLALALTALVAMHINPAAAPVNPSCPIDTTHADAIPLSLISGAMSLLENETFSRLKHTPVLRYASPDQIITHLVDGAKRKRDSIDPGKFDSKH